VGSCRSQAAKSLHIENNAHSIISLLYSSSGLQMMRPLSDFHHFGSVLRVRVFLNVPTWFGYVTVTASRL